MASFVWVSVLPAYARESEPCLSGTDSLSLCTAVVSLLSLCALVYLSPIWNQTSMHMAIVGCNVDLTQQQKHFGNKSLGATMIA